MTTDRAAEELPLNGVRVVEFTHMVMGPTCGMILGDLGADVIKVEPLAGDSTRRLLGKPLTGLLGSFQLPGSLSVLQGHHRPEDPGPRGGTDGGS
jgi:crotonobetainyl-CoA:carnitine CoA-transferase CaiB-like acyl-CoA transferase